MKKITVESLCGENEQVLAPFTFNRTNLLYSDKNILISVLDNNDNYYRLGGHIENNCIYLQTCLLNFGNQENFDSMIEFLLSKYHPDKIFCHYSLYNYKNNLLEDHNYSIELPLTFESLLNREKAKKRYNLKRERRILAEKGFKFSELKQTDFHEAMLKFFEMKKVTHHRDWHLTPEEFIKQYNITNIYALSNGEKAIAFVLSDEIFPWVIYQQTAYDMEWEKYSPGSVIYLYFLEEMIRKGKEQVFLGGGNHAYKKMYGSREDLTFNGYISRHYWIKGLYNSVLCTARKVYHKVKK